MMWYYYLCKAQRITHFLNTARITGSALRSSEANQTTQQWRMVPTSTWRRHHAVESLLICQLGTSSRWERGLTLKEEHGVRRLSRLDQGSKQEYAWDEAKERELGMERKRQTSHETWPDQWIRKGVEKLWREWHRDRQELGCFSLANQEKSPERTWGRSGVSSAAKWYI